MTAFESTATSAAVVPVDPAVLRALVESASVAMVREFLAKRRYRATLDSLHAELPSKPEPTTSSAVARQLGLTKLFIKNTKAAQPYPTLLETLADHLIHKMTLKHSGDGERPPAPLTAPLNAIAAPAQTARKAPQPIAPTVPASTTSTAAFPVPHTVAPGTAAAFSPAPSRAVAAPVLAAASGSLASASPSPAASALTSMTSAAPSAARPPTAVSSSALTSAAFSPASLSALSKLRVSDSAKPSVVDERTSPASSVPSRVVVPRGAPLARDDSELMMEDMDDDVQRMNNPTPTPPLPSRPSPTPTATTAVLTPRTSLSSFPPTTIALVDAHALRTAVFGAASASNAQLFSPAWRTQSFFFSSTPALPFGLVQKEGGPCGLIASVQAEVLRQILPASPSAVGEEVRMRALFKAMAIMLWRAGGGAEARVVLEGRPVGGGAKKVGTEMYKPDGLTESLLIHRLPSLDATERFLQTHSAAYTGERGCGLVLFLYSLVLTRGLSAVAADCDYPASTLIGAHFYCTQEMVNLALTGVACSNVFDGRREMDGAALKGIACAQSACGFLSLFEHYGYIEVGGALKNPDCPVWVVCSESHYSVLYGEDREAVMGGARRKGRFDLFYYDELIQQEEEIRLTVDCSQPGDAPRSKDLEPPLNDCIRTRWGKAARISWNGTDPIL